MRRRVTGKPRPETLREFLLRIQKQPTPELPEGTIIRQLRYRSLCDAYEKINGLKFDGDDPKMIMHYRTSYYGPPCPNWGRLLRNRRAKQYFVCGMDWHEPQNILCHRPR